MDQKVSALTTIPAVDRATDFLYIVDSTGPTSNKVTPNQLLGFTGGDPVSTSDTQTLTNKTLTAPTISAPVLSGTITGTYTIGGTPTFPAAVVTLTGSQTLTNKTLTSPTINTATIANPTLTVDSVNEFTSANGVMIDGVLLKDAKMNGSYLTDSSVGNSAVASGMPVQMVSVGYSAVNSGTTAIPLDDTIPQNTEGDEYMSLAITPKSATNILVIQVNIWLSSSISSRLTAALFQDTTANALAAGVLFENTATAPNNVPLQHTMTAGTTSSTTFKIRAGSQGAGTTTFNGSAVTRVYGAITKSSIVITEYKV